MSFLREETNKLLVLIQQGDINSRNQLFQRTYNHLIVVARKYLNNKNNAEDVVSSAYLRAFEYIASFDPNQDGYNWLCKIVQNLCYDFNKKEEKWVSIDKMVNVAASEDIAERVEQKDIISEYLAGYTALEREFIRLRFYENLSFADIADATGTKKSYVHKRVSKIIKEVLKKVEKIKKNFS